MKVLYLYTEVMGYTMATIKSLVELGVEVHLVYWDNKKLTPYQIPPCSNVYTYNRSSQNISSLQDLALNINPDITVVSGWQDKDYLTVARSLRKRGKIVASGLDGQWCSSARQYFAMLLGSFGYFSIYFSHAWVAGVYQYEYARKLGFAKQNIIFDLYSADLSLFHATYVDKIEKKSGHYPHRFLFVGRLESIKGLNILLTAWERLGSARGSWELHLIGNGSLKQNLVSLPGLVVKDFMQPEQLRLEAVETGCFVLPSHVEPWGVVVHEFAAVGVPLITSDVVGAASTFLVPNLNGYNFRSGDSRQLENAMRKIISKSDTELRNMGYASYILSNRITPETSARNLLSIIR